MYGYVKYKEHFIAQKSVGYFFSELVVHKH